MKRLRYSAFDDTVLGTLVNLVVNANLLPAICLYLMKMQDV